MKLIICEKPSLALNVARALGQFQKREGYFFTNKYIVSFAFGHLFELKSVNDYFGENKRWQDVSLPFIPEKFEFKLKNNEGIQKQFKILQKIVKENPITEIVNCGDADREGQIIVDIIIDTLKTNLKVTRLWLPEQTEDTIRKELKNLSPNEKYTNLAAEGYARTYLDWILGINITRHISLKKGTLLRAGRVMIPVVKFIYDRDLEIKNFKPEKYLQLVSETEGIKLEVKEKFKLKDAAKAEEKGHLLNNSQALVSDLKKEKVKKYPKKLFSLSQLQSELSKSHKINFQASMKSIQSLYEKGYITYPRTNTEYLSINEIPKIESIIKNYPEVNLKVKKLKSIFDDNKVESHSAIIITTKKPKKDELKALEKTIYKTVFNRFVSNFLDEETIISKTTLKIRVNEEIFTLKGETIENEGFLKYEPQKITNNLPKLNVGDIFKVDFKIVSKETQAPSKITESSLSSFLKNPFKTEKTTENEEYKAILEGVEIGTEATRTGIVEKCIKEKYLSQKGQNFSIEPLGEDLIKTLDILQINLYKNRTIEFSKLLKKISRGETSLESLISLTKEELDITISKKVEIDKINTKSYDKEIIGICPKCGKNIYQGKTKTKKITYYCEAYKEGCKFILWEDSKHYDNKIKITKTKAKLLLNKSRKALFKLKNKSGKEYEAYLKLKLNGDYINFDLDSFPKK